MTAHVREVLPRESQPERRQVTVVFCDLVGSSELSARLDPEDFGEVLQAYHEVAADVVGGFEGHVAQYLGDGVLIYFGYPVAHEDDAQRAVRAALGIIAGIDPLSARLEGDKRVRLDVRIGVHTGTVVLDQLGGDRRHERLAVGDTPNIAARLQALAVPNAVVISAATHRLLGGGFVCEPMGRPSLKGIAQPLEVFRVVREATVGVAATPATPLVGRARELGALLTWWTDAVRDRRHGVVLLSGEAGIGKSRLVRAMREQIPRATYQDVVCRGSPYHRGSPFYPVGQLLQRLMGLDEHEPASRRARRIQAFLASHGLASALGFLAALLGAPSPRRPAAPALSAQQHKRRTMEAVVDVLVAAASRKPLLLVVEDLHCVDPSTLDWLGLLVDRSAAVPMLTVLTCREGFDLPWPTGENASVRRLTLDRLTAEETGLLVETLTAGKTAPREVVGQIVAKTDGVPLFVEELTRTVLESGLLVDHGDRYDLSGPVQSLTIPTTLQGSLTARLDRLGTARELAQLAATLGREFGYGLLRAVSGLEDEPLQAELTRLAEAGVLYQRGAGPDATYVFKHALIQDAAYDSLLRRRRQDYHGRIARVLRTAFPAIADGHPELLAHHYTAAGLSSEAVECWHRAGQQAFERSANLEAIAHFTKGLELVATLPPGQRVEQELALQASLGPAVMNVKGYAAPEVAATWERARVLCRRAGDTTQRFPVLWGLWAFYLVRARLATADKLATQLRALAARSRDATLVVGARYASGNTSFWRGRLVVARRQLRDAADRYGSPKAGALLPLYGEDPVVTSLAYLMHVEWLLGYPDQAIATSERALAVARSISHPHSMAFALILAAGLHQYRSEPELARARAEAAVTLSMEQGLPQWQAIGGVLAGWAGVEQGDARGIEAMRQGLAVWRAIGAELATPYWLGLLGAAHARLGHAADGLAVVEEALQLARKNREHHYEPELHRQRGELILALSGDRQRAEHCFRRAMRTARARHARSLELRAATSLARLLAARGKRPAGHRLLAGVYRRFSEGFATADLTRARAQLAETS